MRFSSPKMYQIQNFPVLRPGPRWGSLQRSPRPLAGEEGAQPPSQEPLPHSHPFGPHTQHTHILFHGADNGC